MQTFTELFNSYPQSSLAENARRRHKHLLSVQKEIEPILKTLRARKTQLELLTKKSSTIYSRLYEVYPLNDHGEHDSRYYAILSKKELLQPVITYRVAISEREELSKKKLDSLEVKNFIAFAKSCFEKYSTFYANVSEDNLAFYLEAGNNALLSCRNAIERAKKECSLYDEYITFYKDYNKKLEAYVDTMLSTID